MEKEYGSALEQSINSIEQIQKGIKHYEKCLPFYKDEANKVKWGTYLEILKQKLSEEKRIAVDLISVKVSQLQNRISGVLHLSEMRDLEMLKEQLTSYTETDLVAI